MLKRLGEQTPRHEISEQAKFVAVDYDRCSYCGACVPVCPPSSITLFDATLIIDHATCTRCDRCITVCPTGALTWSSTDEA